MGTFVKPIFSQIYLFSFFLWLDAFSSNYTRHLCFSLQYDIWGVHTEYNEIHGVPQLSTLWSSKVAYILYRSWVWELPKYKWKWLITFALWFEQSLFHNLAQQPAPLCTAPNWLKTLVDSWSRELELYNLIEFWSTKRVLAALTGWLGRASKRGPKKLIFFIDALPQWAR